MVKKIIMFAIALFIAGCGGGKVVSEEDRYLPKSLTQSNLISVDSYNNKDISKRVVDNLFSEDDYLATNQTPLILKRVNREFKRAFRYYQDYESNYSTNYCERGYFDKIKLSDNSYEFTFHNCKKSNSDILINGTMRVTLLNTQQIRVEFNNYKESSSKILNFIRSGSITKTFDSDTQEPLKIVVKNFYAYFRDNNGRNAYYNLNITKNFYDNSREYSVDGYIYLNRYNRYIRVKTLEDLIFNAPSIYNADNIVGKLLIGSKILIIFNGDYISYIYDGGEEDYSLQEFF